MDTFDTLRPKLAEYLRDRGLNPDKRFRCLNPEHYDANPSMGYDPRRHKVHCFACGADYDLFDLLALDEGLTSPRQALDEASRRYGTGNTGGNFPHGKPRAPEPRPAEAIPRAEGDPDAPPAADYLSECAAHAGETDYFAERGLSPETVARFSLGYDPERDCVVLPCGDGRYIRRSTREKRYLNEKNTPSPLFHPDRLSGGEPVFLAEGAFDALSAEELGFRACALNGSGNREKAAQLLRKLPRPAPILLLPDNDAAGAAWADALCEEFPWLCRCPPAPLGKDLNECLTADRDEAARFLESCLADEAAHRPPPYSALSAGGQMDALEAHIQRQAARPALKTGFSRLDNALDGGLYDGLYVLGAVSSLGKTALCMQIADQLARSGRHVLVFSLEMTAFELMARSVSRESFQRDASAGRRLAKTVRGVLDGRRYAGYSPKEAGHLQAAKEAYAAYAGNLWFREGDHETGLEYIEREILRHTAETGTVPVVLVDYLQIIAPADVHFTDKQNLDRAVCALKRLTRAHSMTIIAVSSFNRENYNAEATMAAFKESGGIDYSADVLLGLQARGAGGRSFNIDEEKRKDPRELELKILKNRSGALGEPIPFRYYPAFSCFEEG